MQEKLDISLIIPTYKNPNSLADGLNYLKQNNFFNIYNTEVIIVDDGSPKPDNIKEVVKNYPVILLRLEINKGKGAALRLGISKATKKFILFTDSDIPYKFDDLISVIETLNKTKADIVLGNRRENSINYQIVSKTRRFGSIIFNYISEKMLNLNGLDNQCGLKGFKADVAKKLFSLSKTNRFAIDAEILFIARYINLNILSIPVTLRSRGISTINLYLDGIIMLKDLILIKLFSLKNISNK